MAFGNFAHRVTRPRNRGLAGIAVEGTVIDAFRFEEDHRIIVFDRRDQQTLRIVWVRWHHDLQAADMREDAFGALRMRLTAADAPTARRADRNGRNEVRRAAIAQPRELADDLVIGRVDVVGELDFGDRPQPVHAHADRGADDAALCDRRVDDTMRAIFLLQAVRDAKHAAEITHVLAEHDDRRVPRQRHVHRGVQCFDHVHARHGQTSVRDSEADATAAARSAAS